MQIFTFYYQLKKMMGFNRVRKADEFMQAGLNDSFEPSEISVKNIMAFANAYHHEKSELIGDVDCLLN